MRSHSRKKRAKDLNQASSQSPTPMKEKKKDRSARVHQRAKFGGELNLKPLDWTDKQRQIIELGQDKNTRMILIKGPAGCSKTSLAMFIGLSLLKDQKVSDLVLVRSAVESSDSKLGYLPGSVEEKFGVYLTPFLDKLEMFLDGGEVKALHDDKRLMSMPVNFTRGNEWNVRCIIVDEAQNLTVKELITLSTRVGHYSKMIICADPEQVDIPESKSGFVKLWDRLKTPEGEANGIFCVEFDESEIMRSGLVKFLVQQFKGLK